MGSAETRCRRRCFFGCYVFRWKFFATGFCMVLITNYMFGTFPALENDHIQFAEVVLENENDDSDFRDSNAVQYEDIRGREHNQNAYELSVVKQRVQECALGVDECRPRVEYEIFKSVSRQKYCQWNKGLLSNLFCQKCVPTKRKIQCAVEGDIAAFKNLSCGRIKELEIDEFDLATQYDCILQLAEQQQQLSGTRIPRIGHSVYFYGEDTTLSFYHLLSILSLIRQLRPRLFFFWNDGLPVGRWLSELLLRLQAKPSSEWLGVDESDYAVKFVSVRIERPAFIYNIPLIRVEHASDVARLTAVLLFGGVYLDFDSFAVNNLDPLLDESFVMGYETNARLTDAILLGRPNSSFALLYHCEYADFNPYGWIEHSVLRPHTLAERCPHLIRRENSSLCKPANYEESGGSKLLYDENVYFNLSNNFAVHAFMWVLREKHRLDPERILRMRNTLGRIFRSIYFVLPLDHAPPVEDPLTTSPVTTNTTKKPKKALGRTGKTVKPRKTTTVPRKTANLKKKPRREPRRGS